MHMVIITKQLSSTWPAVFCTNDGIWVIAAGNWGLDACTYA